MEGKTCAQSLAFLQNAISRPVLFFKVSNKYIGKANKMEKAIHNCLKIETKKITIQKWYDGFRHLRDKVET